eukprot:TRINITY_DN9901_c0_g1_i1.p2 TRINITY_DN9901_c0_g1~~TRINITY_DN9901_c0_g1_i1.p2  ORF type:complete len:645 (+),score=264.38 TRINITY_DN9901_c0_g1_i1:30-1937(+)
MPGTNMHKDRERVQSTDESIVAYATVREQVMSSHPSFGDWRSPRERDGAQYRNDVVPCVVEVTRGSPNKYEVDKETGMLVLDRVLHSAVHYPGDYGYIPATLCGDGDPLDLLVISPYSAQEYQGLEPGVIANCRIVGIMDMEDESGRDEKIIAVLAEQRSCSHITSLDSIPPHLRAEIQNFFENYKLLEKKDGKPKWAKVLGWGDRDRALQVLAESKQRYETKKLEESSRPQRFDNFWAPNMLHAPQTDFSSVLCYINGSKGCTASYGYRHDTSFRHYRYTLDIPYPGDSGWITQTWQRELHKPLDVHIITAFPLVSESFVQVTIVGALQREYKNPDGKMSTDYKIIGVPSADPRTVQITSLENINNAILEHYETFFVHSATLNGKTDVRMTRRLNSAEARHVYTECHAAYEEDFTDKKIYNAPNLWCLPWGGDGAKVDDKNPELTAVIECPKGTCNKYEFNKELGNLVLQKPLYSATYWPGNYGFIPQTVAEDGKPVNVLVLSNHPLQEFSLCYVRILGAIRCTDEKGPDVKVIAVPKKEPRMTEWSDVEQVPQHIKNEIENFYNTYKALESHWKFCKVQGWISRNETMEYLKLAHTRFFLFVLPMERVDSRIKKLEEENKRLRTRILASGVKL